MLRGEGRQLQSSEQHGELVGAPAEEWSDFEMRCKQLGIDEDLMRAYGAEAFVFGANAQENERLKIRKAIDEEMATDLTDALVRRTGLASSGLPDDNLVFTAARDMAAVLDWDDAEINKQMEQLRSYFEVA